MAWQRIQGAVSHRNETGLDFFPEAGGRVWWPWSVGVVGAMGRERRRWRCGGLGWPRIGGGSEGRRSEAIWKFR